MKVDHSVYKKILTTVRVYTIGATTGAAGGCIHPIGGGGGWVGPKNCTGNGDGKRPMLNGWKELY